MDRDQLSGAFSATVQASLHGLQTLQQLLSREQAALTGRDPELLQQIVTEKLAVLKELASSVQARDRLQKAAGFEQSLEGGSTLVDRLGLPDLQRAWNQLTELAQTVADLNLRNGQLAAQGQRATRAALGILTGRPTSDDTYAGLRRRASGADRYSLGKV
ncbi:MAG: flagellar protein FlgN [Chromatiaceae bacterium]|nr:flagellar protein FlgN [Gammaproteobacteria bacterium]MCP5304030.1 flagellar protein FlgN [Chromatiaceae bacterium]MCP5313756.1 flagellar protein FlgN [Chromatiaceae bacterium]